MAVSRRRAMRRLTSGSSGRVFPGTVAPTIWFDGRQAMFSDIAGTVPATILGPLGRAVEAAPLSSDWRAPSNGQRGRRDQFGVRLEYVGVSNPAQSLAHTSTPAIDVTNCTLFMSFMPRDASQSPQNGLLRAGTFGLYSGNGQLALTYNAAGIFNWLPAVPSYQKARKSTVVARYTAAGLKLWHLTGGALTSDTLAVVLSGAANSNAWVIGDGNGANQGICASVSQAGVVQRGLSDAEAIALAYWSDAQALPEAFPVSSVLFGVIGDSIARCNPGTTQNGAWCWSALANVRATYPTCEMVNCAVGGSGVEIGMYTPVIQFYSAARARNVLLIAGGTNTLAGGAGQIYCRDNIFNLYDTALAAGWRPVIATILDRTAGLSVPQATFDSERAFVNAAILGSGRTAVDLTGIADLSANGAASNVAFFLDGIHPNGAGHALMEPPMRAAMLALAA